MRMRSWLIAVAITAGAFAPAAAPASSACAAEAGPRAALVVDTGKGKEPISMCVDLTGYEAVSGIDLIEIANEQYDLQYQLGYGGQAVCQLANVPEVTPSQECFEDSAYFWGYWRGDGSGGWTWSGTGAASTRVEDGDVEGWSWGTGRDGTTHPQPRPRKDGTRFTFDSVCAPNDEPKKKDSDTPTDDKKKKKGGGIDIPDLPGVGSRPKDEKTPGSSPTPEPEPDERLIDSAPDLSELELAPTPSPSASELPAGATSAESKSELDDQPPIAGVLALLATMAMALIAVYLIRKRSPPAPEE